MEIEPGDLVVETDDSVCPCAGKHAAGLDGFEYDGNNTGKRFVVQAVRPNSMPGYEGCFMLTLNGLGPAEWCFGTLRKLKPSELPQPMKRARLPKPKPKETV